MAAEAAQNLTMALERKDGYQHLSPADLIALAQVNATLEVAAQLRIANQIALLNSAPSILEKQDVTAARGSGTAARMGMRNHLRVAIAEGLSL
jgi:hypothetical protein